MAHASFGLPCALRAPRMHRKHRATHGTDLTRAGSLRGGRGSTGAGGDSSSLFSVTATKLGRIPPSGSGETHSTAATRDKRSSHGRLHVPGPWRAHGTRGGGEEASAPEEIAPHFSPCGDETGADSVVRARPDPQRRRHARRAVKWWPATRPGAFRSAWDPRQGGASPRPSQPTASIMNSLPNEFHAFGYCTFGWGGGRFSES